MTAAEYDEITRLRAAGATWAKIGEAFACTGNAIRKRYANGPPAPEPQEEDVPEGESVLLSRYDISRITSLDDLLTFFKVDTDWWDVRDFRVNKWENYSVASGVTPLYQVRANLIRNQKRVAEAARIALEQAVADMQVHSPRYSKLAERLERPGEKHVLELAIMDPHLGLLAWGAETGAEDYDLSIATDAYVTVAAKLLALNAHYNVDRIVIPLGNDLLHVDTLMQGRVGTTTSGTPQDFDTRLAKLFTAARKATVQVIDMARAIAPVDVEIVPGNHDEHSMYRLGEVLQAWYRLDDRVAINNEPKLRKYYEYGANGLMFTHGLEAKRKREPLPLIFATEAPDLWARTTYREVHCGHFHSTMERKYMSPVETLTETRGVRVRVLPALTAPDKWHTDQGYLHHRAATALVYRESGGLAGLHEVSP